MNRESVCVMLMLLIGGIGSVAEIETNRAEDLHSILTEATASTEGLFEAGPQPSRSVPKFEQLKEALSGKDADHLASLLVSCKSARERKVLIYALQAQTPGVYLRLLEKIPNALARGELDYQECFTLLFPQGPLAGVVPYNFQHSSVSNVFVSLKRVMGSQAGNEQLKSNLLQAIELIESGQMREAFLENRGKMASPPPLPVAP